MFVVCNTKILLSDIAKPNHNVSCPEIVLSQDEIRHDVHFLTKGEVGTGYCHRHGCECSFYYHMKSMCRVASSHRPRQGEDSIWRLKAAEKGMSTTTAGSFTTDTPHKIFTSMMPNANIINYRDACVSFGFHTH